MKNINEDHFCSDGCTGSGEARVQQRKRRIQRRVQQKQKDQEDEVFGRILSAKKMKTIEELTTAGYRVTTAGSRLLLLYDDLLVKLSNTGFKAATYKRGLAALEDQIVKYKEHEVRFSKEIDLLKRSVGSKEYQLGLLRTELEKVKQEKEGFDFKIAKFDKFAKDLNEMLESQITDSLTMQLTTWRLRLPQERETSSKTLDLACLEIRGLEEKKVQKKISDDETIAQVLITMSQNKLKQKEKEKGINLKRLKISDDQELQMKDLMQQDSAEKLQEEKRKVYHYKEPSYLMIHSATQRKISLLNKDLIRSETKQKDYSDQEEENNLKNLSKDSS
ncbi:hypothetical protein Tco_0517822 [Tanacetum coccineum]